MLTHPSIKKLINFAEDPKRIAIIDEDSKEISYQELLLRAYALAQHLEASGIKSGDRVLIRLTKRLDFLIAYISKIFSSYCVVPINASLPEADVDFISKTVKAKATVSALPDSPLPKWNDAKKTLEKNNQKKMGVIFFTSGTTSRPKGVCHTTAAILENADNFNDRVGHDEKVKMLHVLPVGYVAGLLNTFYCPLLRGATIVLSKQFSPLSTGEILGLAKKHSVNAVWLSPTMAAFLARLKLGTEIENWVNNNLKQVHIGTAPLNLVQKESFEKTFGVKCLESFGMSEILLAAGNATKDLYKLLSAGKIIEGTTLEARDEHNKKLPAGEEGQLFVKSNYAMLGYWNEEKESPEWPSKDEWLDTGDIGRVDKDNYLFITGRAKDLIIKGGVNISPRAIEESILKHPSIEDVAVVGAKHPIWGEDIVAFVLSQKQVTEDELKEFCKDLMPKDSVPSKFIFVEEFPRTSTGKVQKAKLREKLQG